ncbi:oligosaccharide flippase family protein [Streptococcus sp. oral taxon 431]|uniref:oligosaccharide flippase family protein n=1 Tax=Streptococcus sp. oral taxon 431 TaxID=712633 RepID=UPI002005ABA6
MKVDRISFIKNTSSLYILNIVKLLFPLLTLPYLTRVLSLDAYGMVTYVKALIAYVQLVIDFGFMLSATKNIVNACANPSKIGRIVGDTLAEKIFLSIISILIYSILMWQIPIMRENILFSVLYLLATVTNIFIFDFLFRGIEKMHAVAIPYVVSKTIITILTFIVVKDDSSILWIPILEGVGNLVAAVVSYGFLHHYGIKLSFSDLPVWVKDLKESSIYFLSNFATTIFGVFTTVISGFYLQSQEIAFWGIALQLLSAAKSLYNPIANSLYPHMIRTKDIQSVKKINRIMLVLIIFGVLIVLFFSNQILSIIGGEKYTISADFLKYLLPAFVASFYSMIYGWPVLGAIDKVKETTMTTILASIVQILGLGIFILSDNFSLVTLAICSSMSEVVLWISRYLIYFKNRSLFVRSK